MDPDEALRQIRKLVASLRDQIDDEKDPDSDEVFLLVDLFDGLDSWIRGRGALPESWSAAWTRKKTAQIRPQQGRQRVRRP
jgi:hypothetical protein